jgi:hypothetical protein
MTDISLALLEENKRLQVRIDELQIDLTKHAARPNAAKSVELRKPENTSRAGVMLQVRMSRMKFVRLWPRSDYLYHLNLYLMTWNVPIIE